MTITTRAVKNHIPPRQHEPKLKWKEKNRVPSDSESELEPVKKKKRCIGTESDSKVEEHDGARPIEVVEVVDADDVDTGDVYP